MTVRTIIKEPLFEITVCAADDTLEPNPAKRNAIIYFTDSHTDAEETIAMFFETGNNVFAVSLKDPSSADDALAAAQAAKQQLSSFNCDESRIFIAGTGDGTSAALNTAWMPSDLAPLGILAEAPIFPLEDGKSPLTLCRNGCTPALIWQHGGEPTYVLALATALAAADVRHSVHFSPVMPQRQISEEIAYWVAQRVKKKG